MQKVPGTFREDDATKDTFRRLEQIRKHEQYNTQHARMEEAPFRVCEFFSGIGGWVQALSSSEKAVQAEHVQAFDINTVCNQVYAQNYGKAPCPVSDK